MNKWAISIVVVVVLVVLAVILFRSQVPSFFSTQKESQKNGNTPTDTSLKEIQIEKFAYSPSTLTIKVGNTIKWTNLDSAPHTVTSSSGNELASSRLSQGQSYSHTFSQAGTYAYYCTYHPSMKATIIVQ